jgi:hypothetical protein
LQLLKIDQKSEPTKQVTRNQASHLKKKESKNMNFERILKYLADASAYFVSMEKKQWVHVSTNGTKSGQKFSVRSAADPIDLLACGDTSLTSTSS